MEPQADRNSPGTVPLAVVGVGALFPGSTRVDGFWRDILAGKDLITEVPSEYWLKEDFYDPNPAVPDKVYCQRGAFLPKVPFDPLEYGVPPNLLPTIDTSQLLALLVAKQVLEDAGTRRFRHVDRERISVILGVASGLELLGEMAGRLQRPVWVKALRESGIPEPSVQAICERITSHYVDWKESTFPGLLGNVIAGRIASHFDFGGTNCTTDAACASSFSALSMAANELYLGQSDLVIAGGVDTTNDAFMFMCFSKTPALSPTGDCRPFSSDADGTILGEGLGMVALRRLADAERDGDRIYAVIRGIGASSDGRAKSIYAPRAEGQARALRRAYVAAQYGPETVELVEAHGTGTNAGDVAEIEGLRQVFAQEGEPPARWCALGSIKSQIGHTKSSAAVAGLLKVILALHAKVLPPTIKVKRPSPSLGLDKGPFYLSTQTRPWIRNPRHPRRASVSSFGFGGTNFHVTLEEYLGPRDRTKRRRILSSELVLAGAGSRQEICSWGLQVQKQLEAGGHLAHLARSSQQQFRPESQARLALVAENERELAEKIQQAVAALQARPAEVLAARGMYYSEAPPQGNLAVLFPGQGSQYLGNGADLAIHFDAVRRIWDMEAEHPVAAEGPVHHIVFPQPVFDRELRSTQEQQLLATEWAQPALALVSASMWVLLQALKLRPCALAGHSFGEITALHAAGVFDAMTLVRIARLRGELMAAEAGEGRRPGTMTAVSAELERLQPLLAEFGEDVQVANHNAPKQVVLSGARGAIEAAEEKLNRHGMVAHRLRVSAAFHSRLVQPAVAPFAKQLREFAFHRPINRVYSNLTGAVYPDDPEEIRRRIAEAIAEPVRFVDQVEAMYADGIRTFLEVGPGSVLSGLVTQCLGTRPHLAISLDRKGANGIHSLWCALGQLAAAGYALDYEPIWAEFNLETDPLTQKKPAMEVLIGGTNVGKRYPPPDGASALPEPIESPTKPARGGEPTLTGVAPAAKVLVASPAEHGAVPAIPAAPAASVAAGQTPAATPARRAGPAPRGPDGSARRSEVGGPIVDTVPAGTMVPPPGLPSDLGAVALNGPKPGAAPAGAAWLAALQEMQKQTAEAHAEFQRVMARSHLAFLRTVESSTRGWAALAGRDAGEVSLPNGEVALPPSESPPVSAKPAPSVPPPDSSLPGTTTELTRVASASPIPPPARGPSSMTPFLEGVPNPAAGQSATPTALVKPGGTGPAADVAALPHLDPTTLEPLLLDAVSESTGYPKEILNLDMGLETDLGVDSIKRVEILSSLQKRFPGLREFAVADMGNLQTLRDVLEFMKREVGRMQAMGPGSGTDVPSLDAAAPAEVPAGGASHGDRALPSPSAETAIPPAADSTREPGALAVAEATAPAPLAGTPVQSGRSTLLADLTSTDLEDLVLTVVAELTGYPKEVLSLDMGLENDLGIDSIKRVEIMSALQRRFPVRPEVEITEMGNLRSLRDVVELARRFLAGQGAGAPTAAEPAADCAPAAAREEIAGARFEPRLVEAEVSGFAMPGLFARRTIAVVGDQALGTKLAARLHDYGIRAEVQSVLAASDETTGLIYLGLPSEAGDDLDVAVGVNRQAFEAVQRLALNSRGRGALLVTVQNTGGDFGLSGSAACRAWTAGLAALAKTAALEWEDSSVKSIDVERGSRDDEALAEVIAEELLRGAFEPEVALSGDGRRRIVRLEPSTPTSEPGPDLPLDPRSVIVVSGGARGVTPSALRDLAQTCQPRLVLLGRTPLFEESATTREARDGAALKQVLLDQARREGREVKPADLREESARILANREIRENVSALETAGAEVRYVAADILDLNRLTGVLDEVRRDWGPITGLIHAAGVLADRRIAEKTREQFDRVFDVKSLGLRNLLTATAADPLRCFLAFSSIAARAGNVGQADYAMANEVLNKVIAVEATRRGHACLVRSLNWGPWDGGMVTPVLKEHFQRMGIPLLPLRTGSQLLLRELSRKEGPYEVVLGAGSVTRFPRELPGTHRDGSPRTFPLVVDRIRFPFLDAHRIKDAVVVPVALVIEWFIRAATVHGVSATTMVCRDLRVLQGITLDHFETQPMRFEVSCRLSTGAEGQELAMSLLDPQGRLRYTATVAPQANGNAASARMAEPPDRLLPGGTPWPWSACEAYRSQIWHGPAFQVISVLDKVSDEGSCALLKNTQDMGWQGQNWLCDPAVLDGGLQLSLLWVKKETGMDALPSRLGTYVRYHAGTMASPITCWFYPRQMDSRRLLADLQFRDSDGALAAEISDLEVFLMSAPATPG